jgi:hypothetical protein
MGALEIYREWLVEFPGDIETLEGILDAIQNQSIRQAITAEIVRRKWEGRHEPF